MILIISAVFHLSGKHEEKMRICCFTYKTLCTTEHSPPVSLCVSHPVVGDFMSRPATACHPAVGKSDISSYLLPSINPEKKTDLCFILLWAY